MAKKQKKSKKQTKKSAVAGLVKAVAATAANAAQSTKTYKNTVKKSAAPSAKSLAQQGVNAAASAAARQAAAAAAAKRKQEQKRAAARNATASSMQNTKNQQKKRSGLVLSQNRANGNKQKTGLVLPGLAGQKRDAKKEYEKFKEQHGTKAGNQKNRNKSGKKEKSGLVLAQRRTPGALPQTGKNLYQAGKRQMNKSITDEESVKKAIKEGKSISALGTKKKKHNETYDTKRGTSNAILKMGNIASGAAMSATAEQTMRKSFTNPTGHHSTKNNKYWKSEEGQKRLDEFFASEEGKKAVADYQKEIKKSVKKANKQIDKNHPAKIDYSYEDMTYADYNKLATAAQQGRLNEVLKSDKKLANKVADINVKDYVKSAGVMGVLDQMTQGLSVSDNPVYKYSKAQKQIMEKQKETTGYNVGRFVGGAIEFGLGGTGTLGSGLAKTGGKLALTNAAKQSGKTLAKTAAKNVGKEVAADAVVSLPLNSLDALKASYKDGKFDKKTFAKELALNVGGDILIGGGVSGITHGLSARQARNFNRINKTLEKGGTVSKQEMKFYDKHLNELADEIDAAVKAQDGITKSTSASTAANATAKAKGGTSASAVTNAEVKEYARLKGKQNAGVKLTAEEQKSMNRIVAKAVNDNVEKFVDKAVEEVRAARASGEGAIANEAEKLELEKARQEAVIGNSNNPAEIAVAKAKLNEVNAKLDSYKAEHGEKIKKYADADAQAQRLEVGSSGTLNARTPSAEGMTSSADNISDSVSTVNTRGAKATVIKTPYGGKTPSASSYQSGYVAFSKKSLDIAQATIEEANGNKGLIKRAYETLFMEKGGVRNIALNNVSFDGKPYNVYVPKNVVGKVVSDKNMNPEKLAVFDNLDEVVSNASFVGSGKYVSHGKRQKDTIRFDYFETDIKIGKKDYVVAFDVEVFPNVNQYRTHRVTKIDLIEVSAADMGPVPTATEKTSSLNNNISDSAQNVNTREAKLQEANNNVPFKEVAEEAYSNPGKQYDTAAEQIKADNPTPKTIRERAMKGVSEDEVATTAGKMDEIYFTADELHELYVENETKGMFDKVKGMTQAEAREVAEAEIERKGVDAMAKDFIADELPADGHLTAAKVEVLMRELKKSYDSGVDNKVLQMQVVEKAAVEFSSESGRNLNAVKMFLKMTPYGRVRTAMKQADALNTEFASRLKGKKIELSDEQIDRIFKAETDEEIAAVMEKVNLEIWDKIPSSFMEKINTVRHIKMLFNFKTNARNLGGNMAFRGVRSISDAIEYQLSSKVFKRALQNKNIDSVMGTKITHSEISNAKGYIYNDVFPENYKNSNSTNKYVEKRRPDGSTVLKSWAGAGLEKATYTVLELGDIYPAFRPAYAKSYLRWCKHQGIDISDIDALRNMTKKQKSVANQYALKVAEEATFRDTCLISDKLVALKTKTESGQGKTVFGTAGLRMANVVLESLIPYVKTPINVFRRSVDYSPVGLLRALGDFATYAVRKDTDALLKGIHHMSTGLTGTGVMLLGMWLASQDIVMVKAGEVSGDAYYDRDMGYQDYSLIIGGKSITIDWASPMQTSLFMGAQAFNIFQQRDDLDGMDFFNTALTLFEPHLDSSFMSSAKDTLELFVETATGDGTDSSMNWGEAILVTLGGTIPQNYINTFLTSQMTNQAAQAFDKYQRDTRSTSDNPLEKSWEAWGRRVINRVPGFRNMFLNEKINRKGENVKTEGENVVTRLFHAFMNPSNVKTINMTKTDKEIIDIYKNMPATTKQEKEEKRWFFYNLTGQSFDKGDGTRMTYDEAHVHGQKLRGSQWKAIETMTNSKRYKNMDNSMKVKEIGAYNKISTTKADRKVYGSKFATDRVVNQYGSDADKRVANKYRDIEGKSDADFLNFYVRKETMLARAHDTDDYTKAAACYRYGDWQTAKMYGISKTQWNAAKDYFDNKGGSVTKYINGTCNAISTLTKAGADISRRNKAVASADYGTDIATLNAMGIRNVQANMGYGLNKEFGYSYDALRQHVSNAEYSYDLDDSGSLSKSEVKAYIDSLGLKTSAEKACLFEYIYNRETKSNPYGSVPNYLGISNASSSGKSSRKGYRRSSGKGSKASKETAEKPAKSNLPSWEDYVKDYITEVEGVSGVKFKDWDSPLDQAYRNKINSILKKTSV